MFGLWTPNPLNEPIVLYRVWQFDGGRVTHATHLSGQIRGNYLASSPCGINCCAGVTSLSPEDWPEGEIPFSSNLTCSGCRKLATPSTLSNKCQALLKAISVGGNPEQSGERALGKLIQRDLVQGKNWSILTRMGWEFLKVYHGANS